MAEILTVNNRVYLGKDGYIHIVAEGDQTYDALFPVGEKMKELAEQLKKQKRSVNFLIDASKVTKQDSSARRRTKEVFESIPFEKAAIFGLNLFVTNVAKFVMMAIGKSQTVKFFSNEEEAVRWLKA